MTCSRILPISFVFGVLSAIACDSTPLAGDPDEDAARDVTGVATVRAVALSVVSDATSARAESGGATPPPNTATLSSGALPPAAANPTHAANHPPPVDLPAATAAARLPAPTPPTGGSRASRPGVYINTDPVAGRCSRTKCVPLCRDPNTQPDARFPDWGWEQRESCVIPTSPTALIAGGARDVAIRNHGYPVAPRACFVDAPSRPDPRRPPPLDASRLKQRSFTTLDAQLIDAYGNTFVPRAVNNASGWYDICAQYSALEALDNIAATGANSVRIGWAFDSIDPGGPDEGPPEQKVVGTHPELLAEILRRAVELQLVPILTFNDSTGQTDPAWADRLATQITSTKYLRLFKAYEPYLLLGIANELNVPYEHYAAAYEPAIRKLRAKGYRGTLVITANEWGQGCDALLTFAPLLIARDPAHNLLFDLHMYTYVHYRRAAAPNQFAGGEPERIAGCLDDLAELQVPLLIGEFGKDHSSGPVAWETIVQRANANQQGYAPWLWYGDTEYPQLNMSTTWEGPLTEWGRQATADFAESSHRASIFQ